MIRRRSKRSLTTPPTRRKAAIGRVHATPISESAVGRVGELVDLPRDGDDVDAVAEEGHGRTGPEQRKVPDRQGAQDL